MNISAPFIRRPIGTSLLAVGLLAIGAICYALLGISALPQMSFPAIFVSASQPGADASTMASTVAAPLERHLGQVPGLERMFSRSSEGSAFVFLRFQNGVDLNEAANKVQAALNAAQADLPSGLSSPPSYRKANPNDDPVLQLALTSDTQPLSELFARANTLLKPRLSQLPGVASVDVSGSAQPSIRVDVNLHALNAMGLTSNQLRNALRAANVTSPQGFLSNGKTTMAVTANDQLHTVEDFANLVIAVQNGKPVRLRDVANVYQGSENTYQAAYFNGQPSIGIDIQKRPDANVIATVDAIKAALPGLRNVLPPGTHLTPYYDGTPTVRASINEVQITLLISLGMVILTMLFFLGRLAPTLIAATAVPLSLAGAFTAMYILGYTIDNMSLLALVIAISFVVDDAIVVIENIIRHIDTGQSRLHATLAGAREIGFTIVSITASLIAVFIPLLFAPGMIGAFFREFTVTLIAAIFVSAVVSLTLTPSLCGQFLRADPGAESQSRLVRALNRFHAGFARIYRGALDWTLRHALLMALTPLALIFVTIFLFGVVKAGFFPAQDTGLMWGRVTAGSTLSFADMKQRQQRVTQMLLADPAVEYVGSRLGSHRGSASGSLSIQLKPLGHGRSESTQKVLARLSKKAERFPGIDLRLRAHQDLPSGGRGTSQGAQYSIELKGNSSEQLQEWLPKLEAQLKKNPLLRDVGTDVDDAGLRQNIVIDRAKAARLGVSVAAVDDALYNAFGQRQISTIYSGIHQYSVVVSALPQQSATPEALNHVYVKTRRGGMVPISAVAHQEPGLAPMSIQHEDQFTTMDVSFNLAPGASMGEAMKSIHETINTMRLPAGIHSDFGSSFRHFRESMSTMPLLLLGAIFAVYVVLGMLYESLIHPVTILSTLPSAGVGALLALVVTNTELSIVADMALVLLIGLVMKNAIMMIDFALARQRLGMEPQDAIREACLVRFRPIMMTTMVAILAALPLAVGIGTGAELRRPLGIALIGGLIVSQAMTLLSTPALYLIFACLAGHWREWRARRRRRLATG
ncbi:MAG TPA: efflux RND transporter permease subunit [Rhodanobacteraceae bacterium]|nr:efflux RND transporter permease subunit [Rhodanobacteraceae bacterium]